MSRDVVHTVALVARREMTSRLQQRGFLMSTGITLLILAAVAALPGILSDDGPRRYEVAVAGPAAAAVGERLSELDTADADVEIDLVTLADRAEAERQVRDGDVRLAIVDDGVVLVKEEAPERLAPLVDQAARAQAIVAALGPSADPSVAAAVTDPASTQVVVLEPVDEEQDTRQSLVNIGVFILFGQVFGFGFWVASGVVEEKSSRVVEVVLAKVRPSELLAGKVIGIGILGLGQLLSIIAVGLTAASLGGSVDLPPGWVGATFEVLGWFVLGYALYAALFAVAGSLVPGQEELQNTSMPLQFVLMGAFVAAIVASSDPGGVVATIASYVPVSAPLVMPMRVAAGEAAGWEVAIAVAVTVAAIVGAVLVAGRIYAGGVLRTRRRVPLLEAWRGAA